MLIYIVKFFNQPITAPNKNGCYQLWFLIQKFLQAATSVSCKTLAEITF